MMGRLMKQDAKPMPWRRVTRRSALSTVRTAARELARETGRLAARGEFIQYLDSDDLLLPTKFELQVAGLRSCGGLRRLLWKNALLRLRGPAERCGMETDWRAHFDDVSLVSAIALVGYVDPSLSARGNRFGGSLDLAEKRGGLGIRLPRLQARRGRLHYCDAFVSDTRVAAGNQLSRAGSSDPEKLRDRATAHRLILEHALAARISDDAPEMQHFARELFLLARQCGAAGLAEEARTLFRAGAAGLGS